MTNNLLRAGALSCALLTSTAMCTQPALAQGGLNPPPRLDSRSATGVSFATGAFSHEQRDLAIGQGAFPAGLTLERSYLSSLDTAFSAYAGYVTQGWTDNLNIRAGNSVRPSEFPPQPGTEEYLYSIVIGAASTAFLNTSGNVPPGGYEGEYTPLQIGGEALTFTGTNSSGYFTFTDGGGSVLVFNPIGGAAAMALAHWTAPDGSRADFNYGSDGLKSVFSNRGFALLFEYDNVPGGRARTKACAVNRATSYVAATSACPSGVQTVTYQYSSSGTFATGPILIGATNAAGETTGYGYTGNGHLGCITGPGKSGCTISNSYSECYRDPELLYDPEGMRLHEQVLSQTTATGESVSYSFETTRQCPPAFIASGQVTMTVNGAAATSVSTSFGLPAAITDPLGRTRTAGYNGRMGGEPNLLVSADAPEGSSVLLSYDGRGNLIERRAVAKSGSGLADLVSTASYPSACANPRTCNQPASITDARGATTDFTYDPAHGGVLTETAPAPTTGAPRPQTRHDYAQRYAWVSNGSGGHVQAATPVWLRTATSTCRTSAATGNPASPCATAGDEVRTSYDYGPDSGPNNLLLRGQAVTADGVTLRTCFTYDAQGRRIAETSPGAQLAQCS